ncbi:hypothetical protein JZU46_05830, partial [bacterium]|nr:hypothetical protein [bacterium]
LPGVHSWEACTNMLPFLPECQLFADCIEERDALRTLDRRGRHRPTGAAPAPLVSSSKSHPAFLPAWSIIPTTPSWCYQVFSRDAFVSRHFPAPPPSENDPVPRSIIYEFSDKSRAHLDHVCSNSGHLIKSQFCLTYHNQSPLDGEAVKVHLDKWLKSMRRRCPGLGYLWVLEFQGRGVPHFHVFLTVPVNRKLQDKMAKSWVKITKGSAAQLWRHCERANFISWKMDSSKYLLKNYCVKIAQKEVPARYRSVGRFWGSSRNMKPIPAIITPESLAAITRNNAVPWEPAAIRHFFDKILRRYQEKQMNYEKKHVKVVNLEGKKVPWTTIERRKNQKKRKSSIIRHCSELSGNFKIKNGAKIIYQLMNYIADHGPDRNTLLRAIKERIPF